MADTFKVLGQLAPASAGYTALYTVPASTTAVVSSLFVANRSTSAAAAFKLRVRVAGAAGDNKQVIYAGVSIDPEQSFFVTGLGLTLGAGDIVEVDDPSTTLSFTLCGMERA